MLYPELQIDGQVCAHCIDWELHMRAKRIKFVQKRAIGGR